MIDIKAIDAMLQSMWDSYTVKPEVIYMSWSQYRSMRHRMRGDTARPFVRRRGVRGRKHALSWSLK